jgi:hypothetical protein
VLVDPCPLLFKNVGALAPRRHELFFVCEAGAAAHSRQRRRVYLDPASDQKFCGQFGHVEF